MKILRAIFWFIIGCYRALTEGSIVSGFFFLAWVVATLVTVAIYASVPPLFFILAGFVYVWGLMASLPITWHKKWSDGHEFVLSLMSGAVWGMITALILVLTFPAMMSGG